MITENEHRTPISVQIYVLIDKHGLENVAQSMLHLCHEQSRLSDDQAIESSIKHLERLVESACSVKAWK